MNVRCERGSALLVVLGMVAFVVISAVAFSAYMRYSRAPSSFLRQSIASRMLVKAALAEAITEIDRAIGDNPHPGPGNIWRQGAYSYEVMTESGPVSEQAGARNYWRGRVLMELPTSSYVDSEQTVATLTYEGLAYIPPAIINEVRYYSRRTPTAQWHGMDFDAGRYAFCAVDVSDFFDVNIMRANSPRSSSPSSKITLSYLFEGGDGEAWEELTDQFRECDEEHGVVTLGDKVPLISVADMNLAMESKTYGGLQSPFCTFDHKEDIVDMYGNVNSQEGIAKMTFVTDGWYPTPKASSGLSQCDLAAKNEEGQPFKSDFLSSNPTYEEIGNYQSACATRLKDFKLPFCGKAALFDYLDEDNIPVSLAIPTLERVPMVCGIAPTVQSGEYTISGGRDENVEEYYDYLGASEATALMRTAFRAYKYTLTPPGDLFGAMDVLTAYPFRNNYGVNDSFKLWLTGAMFFSTESIGLRLGSNPVDGLKYDQIKDITKPEALKADNALQVLVLPYGSQTPRSSEVNDESSIASPNSFNVDLGVFGEWFGNEEKPFISATISWTQTRTKMPDGTFGDWSPKDPDIAGGTFDVPEATCAVAPLNVKGENAGFDIKTVLKSGGTSLKLYFTVWARVTCESDTVDMAPARVDDDKLNPNNHNMTDQSEAAIHMDVSGVEAPILRFETDFTLEPSLKNLEDMKGLPKPVQYLTKGIMVSDPRHNHAPESWFKEDAVNKDTWYEYAKADASKGDGDMFLSVSDQGYMQSVYELANLPRFCKNGFAQTAASGWAEDLGHMMSVRTFNKSADFQTHGSELNSESMWKTYCPFQKYDENGVVSASGGGDRFEDLNIVSDGNGYKINPYTDSTNVMMAAFACTPLDWACASTNDPFVGMEASKFNTAYAWGDEVYNKNGKLALVDIEKIGGMFMDEMRKSDGVKWEDAWKGLWSNERLTEVEQLLGSNVYNADKKFLYGFWRDCFAVKQQLFLVFVRAEPSMTGGGARGCAPPQLGARAVALVWRDPFASFGTGKPHKTRVLFYRQFD